MAVHKSRTPAWHMVYCEIGSRTLLCVAFAWCCELTPSQMLVWFKPKYGYSMTSVSFFAALIQINKFACNIHLVKCIREKFALVKFKPRTNFVYKIHTCSHTPTTFSNMQGYF